MKTKRIIQFLLTIIFIITTHHALAQINFYIVQGKVIDKNTRAPLQSASVFAQNTTFGVATDANGNFRLKIPEGGYSLIVTFTGYETGILRISNSLPHDSLLFELAPQEKSLETVSITLSSEVKDGWQKYGDFFTKNFIGQSKFAKQCTIQNPEVLHFYFSKKRNRLKVITKEPLMVHNNALGYNLKFAIDSFTNDYNTNTSLFVGYPLFEEMQGTPEQEQTWKANRSEAYKGSMLQLMRSIFNKTMDEDGFELQFVVDNNNQEMPLKVSNFYEALNYDKDDSANTVEIIPNQNEVAIIYKNAKPEEAYINADTSVKKDFQLSTLTFASGESIVIEKNGYYYDQADITTNGYLDFKKVGDMLPYDY